MSKDVRVNDHLIGASPAMRPVLQDLTSAAATNLKVLISGEAGTGKKLAARRIHAAGSRARAPFVTLDCLRVPEAVLETELFGRTADEPADVWRRRCSMAEMAAGGTLFLDGIAALSSRMQERLLQFLDTTSLRVIAASSRDLLEAVNLGRFSEDLYYRLNTIHIFMPPLRARREDIPALVRHFLGRSASEHRATPREAHEEAMARLTEYHWPGNVTELRNVVERLTVRAQGRLGHSELCAQILGDENGAGRTQESRIDLLYDRLVCRHESFWSAVYEPFMNRDLTREDLRALVVRGLEATRGKYAGVVQLFNIDAKEYKRFHNVLQQHGCHVPVSAFRERAASEAVLVSAADSEETQARAWA